MNNSSVANICIRCGKNRILVKSWEEKSDIGQFNSHITYEQFVCPDENCQKMVEIDLEKKKQASIDRAVAAEDRHKRRLSALSSVEEE